MSYLQCWCNRFDFPHKLSFGRHFSGVFEFIGGISRCVAGYYCGNRMIIDVIAELYVLNRRVRGWITAGHQNIVTGISWIVGVTGQSMGSSGITG